jgi:hypothetical protein
MEGAAAGMDMKANQLARVALTQAAAAASTAADTGRMKRTMANLRNWMECVRSRKTTNAHIDAGYSPSVALSMHNIAAIQAGQRITLDDANQNVVIEGRG